LFADLTRTKFGYSAAAPNAATLRTATSISFVVTKVSDGDAGFDYNAVYAPIRGLGVGCDVVPCRADEFEEERPDPTSLCGHVIRTGQKLYERTA
jgi:hypothetical protein